MSIVKKINKLSPRELEILRLIGAGHTTPQLAQELFISTETVRTHRKRILRKTRSKSMMAVVVMAMQSNLIRIEAAA